MSNRPNKRTGKPGWKDQQIMEKNAQIRMRGLPLGDRIAEAIRGENLLMLSGELGIDLSDLGALFAGELKPTPELAIKLKEKLGIEV